MQDVCSDLSRKTAKPDPPKTLVDPSSPIFQPQSPTGESWRGDRCGSQCASGVASAAVRHGCPWKELGSLSQSSLLWELPNKWHALAGAHAHGRKFRLRIPNYQFLVARGFGVSS